MPVLSLQVPEKATCIYWLWHSIYQENEDLFPPLPCREDIMGCQPSSLRIIVRCQLRVLCPVRRYTSVLRSWRHFRKANCVSPGVTWVTSSLACRQPSVLSQCLLCSYTQASFMTSSPRKLDLATFEMWCWSGGWDVVTKHLVKSRIMSVWRKCGFLSLGSSRFIQLSPQVLLCIHPYR